MPSLRALLSDVSPPSIGNAKKLFYVRNTNNDRSNGGCCFLWTVPAGITTATFEMWGGGGEGSGARCCEFNGYGSTSGVYAVKTITVEAGQTWRICAGGSTSDGQNTGACCSCTSTGNPSWVACGSNGTVVACAAGGCGGGMESSRGGVWAYACCWAKLRDGSISDYEMQGTGSAFLRNQYCHNTMYEIIAGGSSSSRATKDLCGVNCFSQHACERHVTCPSFPGGAGGIAIACGDAYRTSGYGAAGMIKVSYQ